MGSAVYASLPAHAATGNNPSSRRHGPPNQRVMLVILKGFNRDGNMPSLIHEDKWNGSKVLEVEAWADVRVQDRVKSMLRDNPSIVRVIIDIALDPH